MLLKEQALKRFQSQFKFEHKKGHRRTKSLDAEWDSTTETNKARRNDKITDRDKEERDEVRDNNSSSSNVGGNSNSNAKAKPSDGTSNSGGGGKGSEKESRSPLTLMWRDRERERDRDKDRDTREKDKEKEKDERHKDGRSWEKDFLAGYARLKLYTSKLQSGDGAGGQQQQLHTSNPLSSASASTSTSTNMSVSPPHPIKRGGAWEDTGAQQQQTYFNGAALEAGSEWATASEDTFTYYDLSPSSKMEGIVSKCLKTKFAPFFFEVHTGCIIYDRINFRGSIALRGSDSAVEVKHSQGPLPRVLFEETEGHIFWIQYREGDLSSSLGAGASSAATGDRRDVPLLSLAASSKDEMMDWVQVMRGPRKGNKRKRRGKDRISSGSAPVGPESPEKSATAAGDDGAETTDSPPSWKKEGWLWVKSSRPGDVWSSYYCLANEDAFEWFKRGVKQVISLENVTEIKTKVLPKGKVEKVRSATFLTTKKQAATTTNSVHLQSLKDYAYKITIGVNAKIPYKERLMGKFKFMVDSEDRMNKWVSSVRGQLGKAPRIGKKHFVTPLGQTKTFRSTVAMRAPKETGKAWLHNFLRDIAERGDAEMGKTPLGNYRTDAPMPKDGKYRIITFDGGGLRSVVSITILERLVEVFPDLLERVNLFCGTSGGSILATSLAMGRSPAWIKTVMVAFSKHIFTRKARQFVTTARYDNNVLGLMGEEMFGSLTLRDVPRSLIITAFQLDNGRVGEDFHSWIPRIFHNLPAAHPRPASHFPHGHKSRASATAADKPGEREKELKGSAPERDVSLRLERLAASVPPAILSPGKHNPSAPIAASSLYGSFGGSGRSNTGVTSCSPPNGGTTSTVQGGGHAGGTGDDEGRGGPSGEAAGDEDVAAAGGDEEHSSGFPVPTWPSEEDLSLPLYDLLMGSSAAPTFFPTHKGFVDGGIFAHNPCMTAVSSAISPEHANQQKLSQLEVLSLGTGRIAQYVEGDDLDWGIMQWARKLPDMIFGGAVWNAALLCRMQLGKSFHRLDPILEKPIPMDDPTQMAEIINVGMQIDLDDTIDWIREHFYGLESKKQRKKKPKTKPRRKARASQWWGQSQLFGEMFSSDEDAIHQSRVKKEDKKKQGWLKSKLGKSAANNHESLDDDEEREEEEESYEEYIKHTITETDDDSAAHDASSDTELEDEDSEDHEISLSRGGKAKEEHGDDDGGDSHMAAAHADIIIRADEGDAGVVRRGLAKPRTSASMSAEQRTGLRRSSVAASDLGGVGRKRDRAVSSGIDEAEVEEEEDDLKTEVDEEVTVSDSDGDDDSPSEPEPTTDAAVSRGDENNLHDDDDDALKAPRHHYSALIEEEEEERDTSDKESEAMLEDGDLAEMAHDVYALEQEIARLMEIKREREQKMEAIHRRRERERKLKVKREAKEREKARLRARQLGKVAVGRTDASPPHKTAAAVKERIASHGHQRAKANDEPPLFTPSHDHPVVAAAERDPDADEDEDEGGKAKECERDSSGDEQDEEEEDEVETDERKLVEVINIFLRRDKKDKDSSSTPGGKEHAGANSKRRTEKEKDKEEGKKAETLSPTARRKIFHSSFSTISSHLPSFAFHSSDKVDKAADRQAVPEQASSSAAAKASVGDADHQRHQRSEVNTEGAHPVTGSGENDDDREREREKKGHSNIVTSYFNRRISDLREHRRKRSASVPTQDPARTEGEDTFDDQDD